VPRGSQRRTVPVTTSPTTPQRRVDRHGKGHKKILGFEATTTLDQMLRRGSSLRSTRAIKAGNHLSMRPQRVVTGRQPEPVTCTGARLATTPARAMRSGDRAEIGQGKERRGVINHQHRAIVGLDERASLARNVLVQIWLDVSRQWSTKKERRRSCPARR